MSSPFSAVLLAGGKSTRMGRDKAFLETDGEPLWRRQLGLLESLGPQQLFLAAARHAERIKARCEVIEDAAANAGPLGGLVAALRVCTPPLLLVLAVDLPCMTADCLCETLQSCVSPGGIVPTTEQIEPLAAVYPVHALPLAEEQLAAADFSMQKFVHRCIQAGLLRERLIPPSQRKLFLNANTPADLESAGEQA